jgi:hypothetical protein
MHYSQYDPSLVLKCSLVFHSRSLNASLGKAEYTNANSDKYKPNEKTHGIISPCDYFNSDHVSRDIINVNVLHWSLRSNVDRDLAKHNSYSLRWALRTNKYVYSLTATRINFLLFIS